MSRVTCAEPFIRCAGGKRKLAKYILPLMPKPESYDTYVEPFAGGAAIFYALWNEGRLANKLTVLGDGDHELIDLYTAVRDELFQLSIDTELYIHEAQEDPETYFQAQQEIWNRDPEGRTPARHLYLRKACWNGLWRTAKKTGEFNTPWRRAAPRPLDHKKMLLSSAALQQVELLDWDFRHYEEDDGFYIGERTLVFLDSPYLDDEDGFTGYLPSGWKEDDARALCELAALWTSRGAYVVLTHSAEEPFLSILKSAWPNATVHEVAARRNINSKGGERGPVPEIIAVGNPSFDTGHATVHIM